MALSIIGCLVMLGDLLSLDRGLDMYRAIWHVLPGPAWAKSLLSLILVFAVVAALFLWVFPAVAPLLPFDQQTVESAETVLDLWEFQ